MKTSRLAVRRPIVDELESIKRTKMSALHRSTLKASISFVVHSRRRKDLICKSNIFTPTKILRAPTKVTVVWPVRFFAYWSRHCVGILIAGVSSDSIHFVSFNAMQTNHEPRIGCKNEPLYVAKPGHAISPYYICRSCPDVNLVESQ